MLRASVALLLALPSAARAQAVIPDEPSCARCTITATEIVTLEDSPVAHMPGPPRDVEIDGRGRYWLVYTNALPLIYGADGQLVRELGPRGDGPDEFRAPRAITPLPGDSVLVLDAGRGTFHVLDPELTARRSIPSVGGMGAHAVIEWPDMLIDQSGSRLPQPGVFVETPFRLFSLGGQTVRVLSSFGGSHTGGVAAAGPFAVWSWSYSPYRLERWTAAGVRTHVLERRPPWFPWTDTPNPSPVRNQQTPPLLQGARQDRSGRLWVLVNAPSGKVWSEGDPIHPGNAMEQYFRTRIEVLDPESGRVIASTLLDSWIVALLPGERAAVYGTDAQGTPYVRIVQLRLVQ